MDYIILCDGKEIAKFLNRSDRDMCLGTLKEAYDDARWEAKDPGEPKPRAKGGRNGTA